MFCSAPFGFIGVQAAPSSAWSGALVSALSSGAPSQAAYTFNVDGTTDALLDQGNSGTSSGPPWENWLNPTIGGSGNAYWIHVTATGAAVAGTTGAWLQLSTARTWTLTRPSNGSSSSTLTIQIASDPGGATVVASGTVSLEAARAP